MTGTSDGGLVDLHLHTTASDGTLPPSELVARAKARGLSAIAITDHDTIGGIREGIEAGASHGLEVVCGVEIGIAHDPDRGLVEVDILGYFVDPDSRELAGTLDALQKAKNGKLRLQIEVLADNGLPVEESEVLAEAAGDTVRRPHIWRVLHRHHPDFPSEEFFDRTSFGGDWHVTKTFSLSLEESVVVLERAGGVPVMAHPGAYNAVFAETETLADPAVDSAIRVCAGACVKGLEVLYPYDKNRPYHNGGPLITKDQLRELWSHYETLAAELGLVTTGGTDFHGSPKPQIEVGEVEVPYALLAGLKALASL